MEWKGPEEEMKAENMTLPCSLLRCFHIDNSLQPEKTEFLGQSRLQKQPSEGQDPHYREIFILAVNRHGEKKLQRILQWKTQCCAQPNVLRQEKNASDYCHEERKIAGYNFDKSEKNPSVKRENNFEKMHLWVSAQ